MSEIFALVDYDNQLSPSFASGNSVGRPPNQRDHDDALEALKANLSKHTTSTYRTFHELRVRLYGGWTSDGLGNQTDAAVMLAQALAGGRSTRIGRVRLFVELAFALITSPHAQLYRTLRLAPWRGARLQTSFPAACLDGASCKNIASLKSWFKNKCSKAPTCRVRASDFVMQRAQKLVDTMLVADAIGLCSQHKHTIIVSRDDDVVPGALVGKALGGNVSIVRYGRKSIPGDYDNILSAYGIDLYDYPDHY